ncbi:hypothetical protein MMC07_009820 [Pseudocyphellaria aurata]|nr:hypothetical protein [Pseudocyphellaria aurata]
MKCSILTSLFLLGVTTLALPSGSIDERSEVVADTLGTMTYVGPITPGGQNYTISGTAEGQGLTRPTMWELQEIHKQILEKNPSFNPDDWSVPKLHGRASFDSSGDALNVLERRKLFCDVGDFCSTKHIMEGIDYLNKLPGGCHVGWGSVKCTRVSCSYHAGITLCNDNFHDISPKCTRLARMAQDVVDSCQEGTKVRGQQFDKNKFNVIVRHEDNHC